MNRPTYPIAISDARHIAEHNHLARLFPAGSITPSGEDDELFDLLAEMGDELVIPPGEWPITTTLTVADGQWIRRADHTSLIRYKGSGTALRIVGSSSSAHHRLPKLVKDSVTWDDVDGDRTSIGAQWVNGNSCRIDVSVIRGFHVGLDVRGEAAGASYNTFNLDDLVDNMIGLRWSASDGGWSNQNTYIGGRIRISSSRTSGVTGSRYIAGTASGGSGGGQVGNGNTLIGASLEGDRCEYSVELTSTYNVLMGCRFESASPILLSGTNSRYNSIVGGYGVLDGGVGVGFLADDSDSVPNNTMFTPNGDGRLAPSLTT